MIEKQTRTVYEGRIGTNELRDHIVSVLTRDSVGAPKLDVPPLYIRASQSYADGFYVDFQNGQRLCVDISEPNAHGNMGQKAMLQVGEIRMLLKHEDKDMTYGDMVTEIMKIVGVE